MIDHDHWAGFADFVAFEAAAGGPSPNLALIESTAEQLGWEDRSELTWLACCYAAIYNTPVSAVVAQVWPYRSVWSDSADLLERWLEDHKDGLPVHSNRRRTHGSRRKLTQSLSAYARFAELAVFETGDDYDRLWAQVHELPAVGRYFGIKLAGTLHRLGLTEAAQYDIRARGAKNGRRTLALLYPGEADVLDLKRGGNSKRAIATAEHHASAVKDWLAAQGLDVDWFQLEALLCEYNQMVKGHRYPGSTSDGDLEAYVKVHEHFPNDVETIAPVWQARESVLPPWLWATRKRKDMIGIYAEQGYVWSDALYDRNGSTDFSKPTVRSTPHTNWEPRTRPEGDR